MSITHSSHFHLHLHLYPCLALPICRAEYNIFWKMLNKFKIAISFLLQLLAPLCYYRNAITSFLPIYSFC